MHSGLTSMWAELKGKSCIVEECYFKPLLNTLKLLREEHGLPVSSIGYLDPNTHWDQLVEHAAELFTYPGRFFLCFDKS